MELISGECVDRPDNESTLSDKKVRFVLPDIMKEQTYGWYPSAKDVYVDRRMGVPNEYQLEAMYKYQNSNYYTAPKPPSPRPPKGFRPSPTPSKRPMSSVSSHHSRAGSKQSASLQIRAKSAPIYDFKPVPKLQIPTPFQCWSTKVAETSYGVPIPTELEPRTPTPSSAFQPENGVTIIPTSEYQEISERESFDTKRERVKSAVIPRQKPTPPPRPIKSAGSNRYQTPTDDIRQLRPRNPTPKSCVPDYADTVSRVATPDQYERDREKYGWRAEVHGDPLKIKKVMKRLPYYVQCEDPVIPPNPPKAYMENMETFFYNTIPRRPMAYTIHKEWVSEVIHAKRMELQKREGLKHRWKNFAFVY
ncbi:uncharacterized protein LOC134681000 isoform X2 [Mytilus trossulus]|uniref:uncharacterized protein LOC134681000 isoform X2 n=2 Tax=Mytilus trossulus TaxID=6551 RepID=UPI0030052490